MPLRTNETYEDIEAKVMPIVERLVEHIAASRLELMVKREIERILQKGAAEVGQDVIIGLLRKGLAQNALDAEAKAISSIKR